MQQLPSVVTLNAVTQIIHFDLGGLVRDVTKVEVVLGLVLGQGVPRMPVPNDLGSALPKIELEVENLCRPDRVPVELTPALPTDANPSVVNACHEIGMLPLGTRSTPRWKTISPVLPRSDSQTIAPFQSKSCTMPEAPTR